MLSLIFSLCISWLCFCVLVHYQAEALHVVGKMDFWQPQTTFLELVILKKCENAFSFQYLSIKSHGRF